MNKLVLNIVLYSKAIIDTMYRPFSFNPANLLLSHCEFQKHFYEPKLQVAVHYRTRISYLYI